MLHSIHLVPFLASFAAGPPAPEGWTHETVLAVDTKLGGCAVGDVLGEHPGDEIVVVAGDGGAHLAWRADGAWQHAEIARTPGEMIQVAIGDADPTRPGNEIVIVGMQAGTEDDGGAGEAHLVFREDGDWKSESLFTDRALIHGVAVGDVDPRQPGAEILLVGFSLEATQVSRQEGAWVAEVVAELPGPGKNAVAYAGGAAIACANGTLVHVRREGEDWNTAVLAEADAGWARLGAAGPRLVAARDDGALALFTGPDAEPAIVHREDGKLRGAVVANLVVDTDPLELATAGYAGRASVLVRAGDAWSAETVYREDARFHHAAAGTVDGLGTVLFVCGYSGKLTAVWRPAE